MYTTSPLSPNDYRNAIRASLSNFSNPYRERFTGFFIGKWFYLTHHCEHEYGHRNTPQSAAAGYIKETENGSELHFLCFRGLFCPVPFLVIMLLTTAFCWVGFESHLSPWIRIVIGMIIALCLTGFRTLMESESKRSQESHDALMDLMDDPVAPFRDE